MSEYQLSDEDDRPQDIFEEYQQSYLEFSIGQENEWQQETQSIDLGGDMEFSHYQVIEDIRLDISSDSDKASILDQFIEEQIQALPVEDHSVGDDQMHSTMNEVQEITGENYIGKDTEKDELLEITENVDEIQEDTENNFDELQGQVQSELSQYGEDAQHTTRIGGQSELQSEGYMEDKFSAYLEEAARELFENINNNNNSISNNSSITENYENLDSLDNPDSFDNIDNLDNFDNIDNPKDLNNIDNPENLDNIDNPDNFGTPYEENPSQYSPHHPANLSSHGYYDPYHEDLPLEFLSMNNGEDLNEDENPTETSNGNRDDDSIEDSDEDLTEDTDSEEDEKESPHDFRYSPPLEAYFGSDNSTGYFGRSETSSNSYFGRVEATPDFGNDLLANMDSLDMMEYTEENVYEEEEEISPEELMHRDSVLEKLGDEPITMQNLRGHCDYPDQKIRSIYRTELMQQANELLKEHTVQETAEIMGYSERNIQQMKMDYDLPRSNFGKFIEDIDVKQEAIPYVNQGITQIKAEQMVRNEYKSSILYKLNKQLQENDDKKQAAKNTGITYGVARKLVKQYQLPTMPKERTHQYFPIGRREKSNIPHEVGRSRTVRVGPSTRLITPHGILRAGDLTGKNTEQLQQMGPFLAMNDKNQLVSCDISSAKFVHDEAVRVETRLGGDLILGVDTKLVADLEEGLKSVRAADLDDVQIMTVNSLEELPDTKYNFFDLLEGDIPITFVMDKEVGDLMINKLILKYDTLKNACKKLDLHYRRMSERRFYRDDLITIYKDLGYPNIKDPNFFEQVDAIGIGGTKAEVGNIQVDEDMLYLAGLVASDGWVSSDEDRKSVLGFSNTNEELLAEYERVLRKYFPDRHVSRNEPSNPKYTATDVVTYNFPMVEFINNLGVKGRDVDDETAYQPIFGLSKKHIASFLQGLFDGDGNVDYTSKKISIAIFDENRVKNSQLLMKKLGIDCKILYDEELVKPPFADEKKLSKRYQIIIEGIKDLQKFIKLINSKHPNKITKLEKISKYYSGKQSLTSKYNYAPKRVRELIKFLREKIDLPRSKIGDYNKVYQLETGYSRSSNLVAREIFNNLSHHKELEKIPEFQELKNLTAGSFNLDVTIDVKGIDCDLIELNISNRIISDNGIILDN